MQGLPVESRGRCAVPGAVEQRPEQRPVDVSGVPPTPAGFGNELAGGGVSASEAFVVALRRARLSFGTYRLGAARGPETSQLLRD